MNMTFSRESVVARVGVAALATATGLLLTYSIPFLHHRESYILYFAGVLVSTWFGGLRIGILACLTTTVLHAIFINHPPLGFWSDSKYILASLAFFLTGSAISWMTARLSQAEASARDAEEIARKNEAWLHVTLASIGDAVIATDQAGKIVFMNSAAETLTGDALSTTQNAPISGIFRLRVRDGDEVLTTPVSRALMDGATASTPNAATLQRTDGSRVSVEGNASPIKNNHGETIGAVLVFRDVGERETVRKKILDYQEQLRSMASELSLAEERERRALANGLHDGITQPLGLMRIQLGVLRSELMQPEHRQRIDDLSQTLKQIISDLGSLTFELSPPILYEFGLNPALEWLANSVENRHKFRCVFKSNTETELTRQDLRVLLFQAARELLTNVAKHAQAKNAAIEIERTGTEVRMVITDDGIGFDATTTMAVSKQSRGFGLFSIRERFHYLGGKINIETAAGRGTKILLTLPLLTDD